MGKEHFQNLTGSLTWRAGPLESEIIEIPANIIVDVLAGKTTLAKKYDLKNNEKLNRLFNEGWVIEACSYKNGNVELGEAPKIVLQFSPPYRVYEKNKEVI